MSLKVVSCRSFCALPLLMYFSPAFCMYCCQLLSVCCCWFSFCCWSRSINALCQMSLFLVLYSLVRLIVLLRVHCLVLLRMLVDVCVVVLISLWSVWSSGMV